MNRLTRWLIIIAAAIALPLACAHTARQERVALARWTLCNGNRDVALAYAFSQLPAKTLTPPNRAFVARVRAEFPQCFDGAAP